jgi:hypothetical protein
MQFGYLDREQSLSIFGMQSAKQLSDEGPAICGVVILLRQFLRHR